MYLLHIFLCHLRSMVGTGFIGYMKLREKYATVLVTNNHVIPTEENAMGSRLTFDNVVPGSRCVLRGCNLFKRSGFWSSPEQEVILHTSCVTIIVIKCAT